MTKDGSAAAVLLTTRAFGELRQTPHIGRAQALRRAMMATLADSSLSAEFAHPMYWAPSSSSVKVDHGAKISAGSCQARRHQAL